jgi:hypothetical protein
LQRTSRLSRGSHRGHWREKLMPPRFWGSAFRWYLPAKLAVILWMAASSMAVSSTRLTSRTISAHCSLTMIPRVWYVGVTRSRISQNRERYLAVLVQVRSACQEYYSFLRATEMPQVVYRGTQQRAAKCIAKQRCNNGQCGTRRNGCIQSDTPECHFC